MWYCDILARESSGQISFIEVKAKICVSSRLQKFAREKDNGGGQRDRMVECVYISVSLSAAVNQNDSMRAKGFGLSSVNYSLPSSRGLLCVCVCA